MIGMATREFRWRVLASCLFTGHALQPTMAGLPMLKQPWLGYYAVLSNKNCQLRISAADPATDKLTKVVIRGKSEGTASLEITVEQSRGIIFLGGRILDPGLFKNPLRCSFTATFPNVIPNYGGEPKSENPDDRSAKRAAKEQEKADEKKLKEASLSLKWTDGKK